MMIDGEEYEYYAAPQCTSKDNKHSVVEAKPPFYVKCEICGTRFYLVAEQVMRDQKAIIVERPLESN